MHLDRGDLHKLDLVSVIVFVDVGLPNKDVVLSLDELPTLTQLWPKVGDELMVALKVDVKGRLWATLATEEMFKQISLRATKKLQNRDVSARVYRLKLVGTYVITTDYYYTLLNSLKQGLFARLSIN